MKKIEELQSKYNKNERNNCRIFKISFQASDTSIIIIIEFLEQSVVTLLVTQNANLHQFLLKPKN